jgi:hypothetical protein
MQEPAVNPYRAPTATVDDFDPADDRPARPQVATTAVALLWVTLVIQAAGLAFIWRMFRLFDTPMYVFAGVITALWIGTASIVAMIERGRNWARITYLVLYLVGLPFFVLSLLATWRYSLIAAGSGLVQTLLQTVALVLLFLRPSREWFRWSPR